MDFSLNVLIIASGISSPRGSIIRSIGMMGSKIKTHSSALQHAGCHARTGEGRQGLQLYPTVLLRKRLRVTNCLAISASGSIFFLVHGTLRQVFAEEHSVPSPNTESRAKSPWLAHGRRWCYMCTDLASSLRLCIAGTPFCRTFLNQRAMFPRRYRETDLPPHGPWSLGQMPAQVCARRPGQKLAESSPARTAIV